MYRLSRAPRRGRLPYQGDRALNWRGSVLNELNAAGFFHSSDRGAFVYDPTAEKERPYRNHGNAVGPTLKEIVKEVETGTRSSERARAPRLQLGGSA